MAVRIGINGFGRIGRNAARIILESKDVVFAAINSNSDAASHAYLLKHDSSQGTFPMDITAEGQTILAGKTKIACFQKKEAGKRYR